MMRDPVCYALVDETSAGFSIRFEHEAYYFCSKECLEKFEARERLYCDLNDKGWVKRRIERLLRKGGTGART